MEEAANNTTGVKSDNVNFMTLKMTVDYEDNQDIKSIIQEIRDKCKKIDDECEVYF